MELNYAFIPKLQRLHISSVGMDKKRNFAHALSWMQLYIHADVKCNPC